MRLTTILLFLLNFNSIYGNSGNHSILWNQTYSNQYHINDLLLLPTGELAAVGSKKERKNKSEGILLFLDPITGKIIKKIPYDKSVWKDEFQSIAKADDGTFYIVGYTEISKRKRKGWVLHVDEMGKKINELELGENASELTNIVWLPNNTGLIAGYKNGTKTGKIWLLNIKDGKIIKEQEVGEGNYKDIKGMVVNVDGSVWICGNTSKALKKGNLWVSKTNASCQIEKTFSMGQDKWHTLNSASGDFFGNLLLSGYSQTTTKNAWFAEVTDTSHQLIPINNQNPINNFATYAYKSPFDINWISTYLQPEVVDPNWVKPYLTTWKNTLLDQNSITIEGGEEFRITKILRAHQGHYILAGNMAKTNTFRLVAIKERALIAAKAFPKLENTKPAFYFSDKNGDDCFSPNERGYIEFNLKNIGTSNLIDGLIKLTVNNKVEGITFQETFFLPFLPKDKELPIKMNVTGQPNLKAGLTNLSITVSNQGQELLNFTSEVESVICQKNEGKPIKMSWQKPDIVSIGSREVRTVMDAYTIQLNIQSPADRVLKLEDPKVYKNGILLADEKNAEKQLSLPMLEGNNLEYRFNYNIRQLQQGRNVIYVQIDEQQTDSITIYYEPRKPNLHVLAIGPTYNNLKYTAKDARDFAMAVSQKVNMNFFERIYVDTLVTPETTTTNDIRRVFESIKNRFYEQDRIDRIDKNDYLMVFISGHGLNYNGQFRFLPTDFDYNYVETTSINYERDIIEFLNQIECKKIAFIDACLSGTIEGGKGTSGEKLSNALLLANESAPGTAAFASCSDNEQSYENKTWENGAFTEAILEALNGEPVTLSDGTTLKINQNDETGKDIISIKEVHQFLQKRVPDLLKGLKLGVTQNPKLSNQELDMNLPLFILK